MKKGQTAMEYLMTYGWAILIILIVGAVLAYYGIFNPAALTPKGGCTSGSLYIASTDWFYDPSGNVTIRIENRAGQDVNLSNVSGTVAGLMQDNTAWASDWLVATGTKSPQIAIAGLPPGDVGDIKSITFEISYTIPEGVGGVHTYSCSVSGKVGE